MTQNIFLGFFCSILFDNFVSLCVWMVWMILNSLDIKTLNPIFYTQKDAIYNHTTCNLLNYVQCLWIRIIYFCRNDRDGVSTWGYKYWNDGKNRGKDRTVWQSLPVGRSSRDGAADVRHAGSLGIGGLRDFACCIENWGMSDWLRHSETRSEVLNTGKKLGLLDMVHRTHDFATKRLPEKL